MLSGGRPALVQKDGTKAPILVTLDGPSRLNLVRNALDNLTISTDLNRKLPAFIAIGVENGGNDGKGSERGLEYDTMSDRFARFITDEVLPAVLSNPAGSGASDRRKLPTGVSRTTGRTLVAASSLCFQA